jgi:CubicO group peptidase (beta-lactamase class C family)
MYQTNHQRPEFAIMARYIWKTCLKGSLVLIFLLFFQVLSAQVDISSADNYLQKNQKAFGNELVVWMNKDGKPLYKKELGKDFTAKVPAEALDISQWFTAALVMVMVDEGKISLDDPIARYLPDFEKYMKGYITFRHCLSHTTGLDASTEGIGKLVARNKFSSLDEEVNTYIEKRDILDNPGEALLIGRMGISIAAKALEAATKKSFDRLAAEKLFRPMGMKGSTFYKEKGGIDAVDGAVTTANDVMIFMQMLLGKGTINGKKILNEASVEELRNIPFPNAKIRFKPELEKNNEAGLITWIEEKDASGKATVISQGLSGTIAWLDFKNNTSAVIFLKDGEGEKKATLSRELKKILSGH